MGNEDQWKFVSHLFYCRFFLLRGQKKTLLDLGSKVHRTFIPLCLKQKSSHYYNEVRKFSRFNEPPNLFAQQNHCLQETRREIKIRIARVIVIICHRRNDSALCLGYYYNCIYIFLFVLLFLSSSLSTFVHVISVCLPKSALCDDFNLNIELCYPPASSSTSQPNRLT